MKAIRQGECILITGASSGIGEALARTLAGQGCHLALCARRVDRLQALQAELQAQPGAGHITLHALDVTDHAAVFRVFAAAREALGRLDRVIVNAGVGEGRRVGTGHFAINCRTAEVNFVAAMAQCEAAVGIFRAQQSGHLVTIASMSAVRGMPRHLTTYAATKAALVHYTEGIRAELLATPIRVTCLLPGYIRTEINAGAGRLLAEVTAAEGARLIVRAIAREPAQACVPAWPWWPLGLLLRHLPLRLVARWV